MIWESLTASIKTTTVASSSSSIGSSSSSSIGGGDSAVSTCSTIDTTTGRISDDNGGKNSNGKNLLSSSSSSSQSPRPSLSLCITHDRFEPLIELLEAETKPTSSSSSSSSSLPTKVPPSLSDYTSVKFLQCTKLPPPQVIRRMDQIQHLSFTQCHGLTSLLLFDTSDGNGNGNDDGNHHCHDHDHDYDDDNKNKQDCSCCCCYYYWSTKIETLTITDCPDLMMFSKSLAGNKRQKIGGEEEDEEDSTNNSLSSPVSVSSSSSSSSSKQLHQRCLLQLLQLSKLFFNLRKLCIVECGRATVLSLFDAWMFLMDSIEVVTLTSRSDNYSSTISSSSSSSIVPHLKELHLQWNHLTSEDVSILFSQRLLLQHQKGLASSSVGAFDQLEVINLLGNSIDTLDFVNQNFHWFDNYSHGHIPHELIFGLRRLKQIILSGNPVVNRKETTTEKNPDENSTTGMDWSVSGNGVDDDHTVSSSSSTSSAATGSSRSLLMGLPSSSSVSIIPFHGIVSSDRIYGLSRQQINIVKLLQMAPQLHFFGYAFQNSNLYSKEAQHLININKSGGRLLMPLLPMVRSDTRSTKNFECQLEIMKVPAGIWPYVFERSNRMYNIMTDDSENLMMEDKVIAKPSCCADKKNLSATKNADAMYFLLRHGSSFAGREAI